MPIRPLGPADRGLLRTATLANMNWSEARFSYDDVDGAPDIVHYFTEFPAGRDFGLVDDDRDIVRAVAWLVYLPAEDPGYGFVDADTPELSITTFEEFRGGGIGTTLLEHLIDEARARGLKAISLSVEDGNRARRLYERAGFAVVGRSDTMLLKLG